MQSYKFYSRLQRNIENQSLYFNDKVINRYICKKTTKQYHGTLEQIN